MLHYNITYQGIKSIYLYCKILIHELAIFNYFRHRSNCTDCFSCVRNRKDEKVFEEEINNDYPKPKAEEGDAPIEEALK